MVVLVSAADRKYQDDFTAIQSFLKEHLQEDYSRKKIVLLVNKAQNKTSSAVKKDGKYTWCNAEHVQAGKALGRFLQGLL